MRSPPLREFFPNASIPPRYAEEGASISINPLQPTASRVRSLPLPAAAESWRYAAPTAKWHSSRDGRNRPGADVRLMCEKRAPAS